MVGKTSAMSFEETVSAVRVLRKEKILRTLADRDDLVPDWLSDFEGVKEWADEVNEKATEIGELLEELIECDRVDMRDFQANVRNALDELLELLGEK